MQIEINGRIDAVKFYKGEELYIKIIGEEKRGWQKVLIYDFIIDKDIIVLDIGKIMLDDITAIKTIKQKEIPKQVRNKMLISGLSFLALAPLDPLLRDREFPIWGLWVGGSLVTLGLLQEQLAKPILQHRLGKRKRLRLVDVSF
jgi:hypothetical protein